MATNSGRRKSTGSSSRAASVGEGVDGGGAALRDLNNYEPEKRTRALNSAMNMFLRFLTYLSTTSDAATYPFLTFSNMSESDWNGCGEALFGKFSEYMFSVEDVEWGTASGYLSNIRNSILKRHKNTTMFNGIWYTGLRRNLMQLYFVDRAKKGKKIQESAVKMKEEDLELLCSILLKQDNKSSSLNRCLLVLQWHVLGRIAELGELRFSDITYVCNRFTTCLCIDVNRFKTNLQQNIHVFIHNNSWKVCPIHALASMLILHNPTDYVFKESLNNMSITTHLNNLLDELYNYWKDDEDFNAFLATQLTPGLKTHSVRSGSINMAGYHHGLLIQWLIQRGGWAVDGMQTIFNYLAGILYY
jgi:hypothetical protein